MGFKQKLVDEAAEAEQKVADLTAQIEDAKLACAAADSAATNAVLAGKDVDAAVSAAGKASAEVFQLAPQLNRCSTGWPTNLMPQKRS